MIGHAWPAVVRCSNQSYCLHIMDKILHLIRHKTKKKQLCYFHRICYYQQSQNAKLSNYDNMPHSLMTGHLWPGVVCCSNQSYCLHIMDKILHLIRHKTNKTIQYNSQQAVIQPEAGQQGVQMHNSCPKQMNSVKCTMNTEQTYTIYMEYSLVLIWNKMANNRNSIKSTQTIQNITFIQYRAIANVSNQAPTMTTAIHLQ